MTVLHPLSAADVAKEAASFSQERILKALEEGRADLLAVQAATRYCAAPSSRLRFA